MRVARSRELVARGFAVATVAHVMQISRQALYRTPTPRTPPQRRPPADPIEQAIVDEATANQTDGYRMVTAFVRRRRQRQGPLHLPRPQLDPDHARPLRAPHARQRERGGLPRGCHLERATGRSRASAKA